MDESKFNLWRATFSFCFVDGFLDAKEEVWIADKLKTLPFTKEQASTLLNDFKAPPAIERLLPLITKPADRGFLLNHMRLIARIDNALSPEEKDKIHSVQKAVMSKIDVQSLHEEIATNIKIHDKKSYLESIIEELIKV